MDAVPLTERRRSKPIWIAVLVAAIVAVPAGGLLSPHTAIAGASPTAPSTASSFSAVGAAFEGRVANFLHPGANPALSSLPNLRSPSAPSRGLTAALPTLPGAAAPVAPTGAAAALAASTSSLVSQKSVPAHAIYPPSLHLASHPPTSPSQAVSPTYQVAPAPMGLADYGLGPLGSNYSVYTPDVLGTVTLAGYNATAGPMYEDTGAYYWDGLSPNSSVTPWQSGLQLNTVVSNVSYPGANNGSFWTQNVVDFSGNSIQFIDNVWNFSSNAFALEPGTLYSYNGNPIYPVFYYAFGPTLPVAYPMTLQLYNNASIIGGRTAVTFGYRVSEPTQVFTGVYDTVVFNSQPTISTPLLTPDYLVSGSNATPSGLLYDAELIFGGPGGGSNAVINALNGSMSLAYGAGASWTPASATYDYGSDTGETSIGFAGYYSGATEFVNQGPSMLYGLWNTTGGVPSGSILVNLTLDPSYMFLFIGQLGTSLDNLSYVPTDAEGNATTWLPPGTYEIAGFADGFDMASGVFSGPIVGIASLTSDPGVWNAPLYMNGVSQAEELAFDTTAWTSGALVFANIEVNVSQVFNHLNDFGFPEFDLLWAYNVTAEPLWVINVTQGPDNGTATNYYTDVPGQVIDAPGLGGEIAVWNGSYDFFLNEPLFGYTYGAGVAVGGAIALWNVSFAYALNISSYDNSFGVWAANSPGTLVADSSAWYGAAALSLLDSPQSGAVEINASFGAAAVFGEGGWGDAFQGLYAAYDAVGFFGFLTNDSTITDVQATQGSAGLYVEGDAYLFAQNVSANNSSVGIEAYSTSNLDVAWVNASSSLYDYYYSTGIVTIDGNWTTVSELNASFAIGARMIGGSNDSVTDVWAWNGSYGVLLDGTGAATVGSVWANDSLGVEVDGNGATVNVDSVNASYGALGVLAEYSSGVNVAGVTTLGNGFDRTIGVLFAFSDLGTVSSVSAWGYATGVNVTSSGQILVSGISSSEDAIGAFLWEASEVAVTGVTVQLYASGVVAVNSSYVDVQQVAVLGVSAGVVLQGTNYSWVSGVSAYNDGLGVIGLGANFTFVEHTNATNGSAGVVLLSSAQAWVNDTNATAWSLGVVMVGSEQVHALGVVASDPYETNPWQPLYSWPVPIAAVVTEETYQATVSHVAATAYPAALLDFQSSDLVGNGLNNSFGDFGVMLNGTWGSLFDNVQAYGDLIGLQMNDNAQLNTVTQGSFVANVGYGVDLEYASHNVVFDNSFVGNNGAGATYNASHLQAFSANPTNAFNNSAGVGNYWADWHTYAGGVLAPYTVLSGAWDYHPLGAPEGMFLVTFTENGLPLGTSWSVTLGATTESTTGAALAFAEYPGSYAFSVGGVASTAVSPSSGSILVATGPVAVAVTYTPLYAVSFEASGLSGSSAWTVYLNGVPMTGTGATLSFSEPAGTYSYTVVAPAGWAASPSSGTLTVAADYAVPVSFASTAPATTTVTFSASGLGAGTHWTVVFGGVAHPGTGSTISFSVDAGTYAYQVESVANYTAAPSSGTVTVTGSTYEVSVAFTALTYAVTFAETGLSTGTVWSVTVGASTYTTSANALTVMLPNGSVGYTYGTVGGYSIAAPTGTVTVAGNPAGVSGAYAPNSTPSYVPTNTFNQDWAIAIGLAALAIVIGLVAMLRRPKAPPPAAKPAASAPASPSGSGAQPWSESGGPGSGQ
jgi:hypothetical protein